MWSSCAHIISKTACSGACAKLPLAREKRQAAHRLERGRWSCRPAAARRHCGVRGFCRPAVRQAIQSAAPAPSERLSRAGGSGRSPRPFAVLPRRHQENHPRGRLNGPRKARKRRGGLRDSRQNEQAGTPSFNRMPPRSPNQTIYASTARFRRINGFAADAGGHGPTRKGQPPRLPCPSSKDLLYE